MKKQILTLTTLLLVSVLTASAQQWAGSSTTTGLINRDGNVLLGSTPMSGSYGVNDRVLQVKGVGSFVTFRSTAYSGSFDIAFTPQYGGVTFNSVDWPIGFSTNYVGRLTILTNGNIGMGTGLANNPNGYKLAVNGKIGAKEVQVENTSSTWADYVFEPDYKLLPLSEVKLFIKANKHLPEIPSAEEIKTDGHKLGEMDVLLLKKIEELTLYLIEQQSEIQHLKKELNQLKKK